MRRRLTIAGPVLVTGLVAAVIGSHWTEFSAAFAAAPVWFLLTATVLQLVALLTRSEAWAICVDAAGGTASRRPLFRAAGFGSLASQLNGQLGVAARIAALRRSVPDESPRVPALVAAELPIVALEATLAALTSFTLVGPLGLPWWSPLVLLAAMAAILGGMGAIARGRERGFWSGLAVMRSLRGRNRVLALILVAVIAQISRNWLALHAIGIDASLFDATAVLIVMVTLSALPVGPSVGAAAVVLILGAQGVGATAAAGVLLTATGAAGALCFAGWALADRAWQERAGPPAPA